MSDMQHQLSGLVVESKNGTQYPPSLHLVLESGKGLGAGGGPVLPVRAGLDQSEPFEGTGVENGGKVVDNISI